MKSLFDNLVSEFPNRVHVAPALDLLTFAVGACVAWRVTTLSVRVHVEKHGALARLEHCDLSSHGVDYGERVVAVNGLCVEVVTVEAGGDGRKALKAHRLAVGLPTHTVEVVHEEENDFHATAVLLFPEVPELAHGRKVEGLPDRTTAGRSVADVGNGEARLLLHFFVESGADRNVSATPDDRVVGKDTEGSEECVHGSSHAAIKPCATPEDLCEKSIEQKVDRQLCHVGGSVRRLAHDA